MKYKATIDILDYEMPAAAINQIKDLKKKGTLEEYGEQFDLVDIPELKADDLFKTNYKNCSVVYRVQSVILMKSGKQKGQAIYVDLIER